MTASFLTSYPPDIREAHTRWLNEHDLDALDRVILAVVAFHLPSRTQHEPLVTPPDSARLMEDLGYDSLAVAEIVFFFEDLYAVTISTQDLRAISTIAELRTFVRNKVSTPPSA